MEILGIEGKNTCVSKLGDRGKYISEFKYKWPPTFKVVVVVVAVVKKHNIDYPVSVQTRVFKTT